MGSGTPKRPVVRYHGGKWKLAPWIISHFPKHRIYCEGFGGGESVLMRKERSYAEIYNDLDGEMVNLFRVLRNRGTELKRCLELTPFARTEFLEAWHGSTDPLEQARRTIIRAYMGFGSASATSGRVGNQTSRGGLPRRRDGSHFRTGGAAMTHRLTLTAPIALELRECDDARQERLPVREERELQAKLPASLVPCRAKGIA